MKDLSPYLFGGLCPTCRSSFSQSADVQRFVCRNGHAFSRRLLDALRDEMPDALVVRPIAASIRSAHRRVIA